MMRMSRTAITMLILVSICSARALAQAPDADAPAPPTATEAAPESAPSAPAPSTAANIGDSICLMIEAAARSNDLPLEFFARVIWQESRFQPGAVGPRTRSGDRAQGIAQFMPRTAAERGLLDPFDPVQALPKSAEFLRELRGQFGNLGLPAEAGFGLVPVAHPLASNSRLLLRGSWHAGPSPDSISSDGLCIAAPRAGARPYSVGREAVEHAGTA
jgi:soluble lytic murein transglycosylase-like protein